MDLKKLDKYYLSHYNITFLEYTYLLSIFGGKCWVCGKLPGDTRLHTDHDHKVARAKVRTVKQSDGLWYADAPEYPNILPKFVLSKKRNEAIQYMKRALLRASVRGVICFGCNRAIRAFYNDSERMIKAGQYLKDYQEGLREGTAIINERPIDSNIQEGPGF